jgi:chlorobactene glucosyltransferase
MTILNVLTFPRLQIRESHIPDGFSVSILIPARNEAAVIEQTIRAIRQQSYTNFQLILLDDSSTDGTGAIARAAAESDSRIQIISGQPLPQGWAGKNWACHQLSQQASGDILLFTDADVRWQPDALLAILQQFDHSQAHLLSIWPTQTTISLSERMTVPLMAFVILGYLPLPLVHYTRFASFAAANGQCMIWDRHTYQAVKGHQSIRADVLDDVKLARKVKSAGYRLRMADANTFMQTRMYSDWSTVRAGFAKNILAGYGNSVIALLLAIVFHWAILILPWIICIDPAYRLWGSLLIALSVGSRMLSAQFTHQRKRDALLLPVSALLMTIISFQSIRWHFTGGPRWKGRTLSSQSTRKISA